ncbi:MAG: hypothetical protein K2L38_11115 [Dysosmobacter sp.]|nr:hypothetical protein [Dysosmobacter sp.]
MIFPYSKTTRQERIAISNAMWPIFTGLEQAQTLLGTCLEDHFEDYPQKAITESEAEWLADMLHIVNTMLGDAIMSFKLTVGWTPGTKWFEGSIDEHRRVLELDAVNDEITDIWQKLPVEQRKPIEDRRQSTQNADDETALAKDCALLEKVKALYLKGGEKGVAQ